jgi:Anti-sigma-K factor rskA
MTHLDDETLALFALGDASPDADQQEHLRTCSRCAAEVESLTRLVSIGRTARGVEIVQPPATAWNGIHAELGLSDELADVPRQRTSISSVVDEADVPGASTQDPPTADQRDALVSALPQRPVTRWWLVAAALAIGVVAGSVGSTLLSPSDDPKVLAEAVLEPFPDWQASGAARVEENADGSRAVVVDLSAPGGGLREVWLIDPDTSGLVSLGLLSGTSGTFSIPADLDLSRFSVVDVSDEPDDGDPAHSGVSIVRGPLSSV